jgi:hypothetical protein
MVLYKVTFFVPVGYSTWLPGPIIWLKFQRYFVEDLPMIIPGQFGFNCPSGFREEAF